jgi:hypothetical protein
VALVAALLLIGLTAYVVVDGTSGSSASTPSGTSGVQPVAADRAAPTARPRGWAVDSVRASVERARAGAPLPRHPVPSVGRRLSGETAGLGRCDYGVPHTNAGGLLCVRGDRTADRTLVVLGDSHARHWVPAFQEIAHRDHYRVYYLVKQQCTAAMVPNGDPADPTSTQPWQACADFRTWAVRTIGRLDPDVVVVSTSVPTRGLALPRGFITKPRGMTRAFARGFTELWTRLHAVTDARLVLLRDVPARAPGTAPQACFHAPHATLATCLSREDAPSLGARVALTDISVRTARRNGVDVVDPTRWFCWDGVCPGVIGHYLPYRNAGHLTVEYARHLADPQRWFLHL